MRTKLVYKYRAGDEDTFKRDLDSIEENYFYAPNFKKLNDPCETLVFLDEFNTQASFLSKILGINSDKQIEKVKCALNDLINRKEKIGIYSLSQTYKDELLWAHYASSHFGFCIEYDLEALLDTYKIDKIYSLPVTYSNTPPQIGINEISGPDGIFMIDKIAYHKSIRWEYEKEHRLIIDRFGEQVYNYKAVKSIYFGLRMEEKNKVEIMNRLQGRGIKYFKMVQVSKTYDFDAIPVKDINPRKLTYLKEIPSVITGSSPVKYIINKKDYSWATGKATIEITLESKIDKKSLEWLAQLIKKHLFKRAERIYMFYQVKGDIDNGVGWATSHFLDGEIKVSINDLINV